MKGASIKYSIAELKWLSDNRTLVISDYHSGFIRKFNRFDVSAINLHALRKRKGWKTGRTGRFEKGHLPAPNARPKGANSTSFKKGSRPYNWKPVGSTRITKDGFIEIKTQEPKKWELYHRVVWQKNYGDIPKTKIVSFKDSNPLNCDPDNLELISRSENLQINKLRIKETPDVLKPTVRLVGKLIAKTQNIASEQMQA